VKAPPPDPRAVLAARRALLPQLEARLGAEQPASLERALRIVDALAAEARALGAWPPADPLGGVDVDVRIAGALRRVR
jgi:hypothetical protein